MRAAAMTWGLAPPALLLVNLVAVANLDELVEHELVDLELFAVEGNLGEPVVSDDVVLDGKEILAVVADADMLRNAVPVRHVRRLRRRRPA